MKPDRFELSFVGRMRLPGQRQRRGAKVGSSTRGVFIFGGIFVLIGFLIVLVGTKIIPVDPKTVHAPYAVLTLCGLVFMIPGLVVVGMARIQFLSEKRQRLAKDLRTVEPALIDYPWDTRGYSPPRWKPVVKALGWAAFLTLFVSLLNWMIFTDRSSGTVAKVVIALFDLAALWLWCVSGWKFSKAVKFGKSRLEFARFPYHREEPIFLRWLAPSGVTQIGKGTFTLRSVVEWFEQQGSGKNATSILVHEEQWSGTWFLDHAMRIRVGDGVELRCEWPHDSKSTEFSADMPVFWELEVKLDLPGLDFAETYLVPIY